MVVTQMTKLKFLPYKIYNNIPFNHLQLNSFCMTTKCFKKVKPSSDRGSQQEIMGVFKIQNRALMCIWTQITPPAAHWKSYINNTVMNNTENLWQPVSFKIKHSQKSRLFNSDKILYYYKKAILLLLSLTQYK